MFWFILASILKVNEYEEVNYYIALARFDSLEKRLPLIERLVQIESRIDKIEKQIGIQK